MVPEMDVSIGKYSPIVKSGRITGLIQDQHGVNMDLS
jgi:hypothetical protein